MADTFGWLDVDRIAEDLVDAHPGVDPLTLNFVELRDLVRALPGFEEDPKHPANERILETIQANWHAERLDLAGEDED